MNYGEQVKQQKPQWPWVVFLGLLLVVSFQLPKWAAEWNSDQTRDPREINTEAYFDPNNRLGGFAVAGKEESKSSFVLPNGQVGTVGGSGMGILIYGGSSGNAVTFCGGHNCDGNFTGSIK